MTKKIYNYYECLNIKNKKVNNNQKNEIDKVFNYFGFQSKIIKYIIKFLNNNIEKFYVSRIKKILKSKKGITLKKAILLYGKSNGLNMWNEYCKKQSTKNTFEFKNKKYGWSKEDFKKFNLSRSSTLNNFITRHGEIEGNKRWLEYCKRESYAGSCKEYFIEKYGEIEGNKRWLELNIKKKLCLNTFIRKYGEIEGNKRWLDYINKTKKYYSKSSQKLFWNLYNNLNINKDHIYFAELNYEFGKYDNINKKYYKYDFVITDLKICIEYNGDHWHANPKIYNIDDTVNCIRGGPQKVIDIWCKDKLKKDIMINNNYNFIYVWDSDYIENPNIIENKLIGIINETNIIK